MRDKACFWNSLRVASVRPPRRVCGWWRQADRIGRTVVTVKGRSCGVEIPRQWLV